MEKHARTVRAADGFTLVELLVVVAIIGMLAALLMPAIAGSAEKAKSAKCLGSLRQVGIAVQQYVNDNDFRFPPIETVPPSLGNERALFSWLDSRPDAFSGDALADWFLLFHHVSDGRDDGFEERLQLRFLTKALNQFDPRCDRTLAGIFEGIERAARHPHALRHVGLSDLFLNPQMLEPLTQNKRNLISRMERC
jgi:prepilin-type N-terminal cleavage/methylation domain-containing protein